MKNLAKMLFMLAVFFGLLSANVSGRIRILKQNLDDDDQLSKPVSLPNAFGGGFTFPGAGGWFPGQGGSNGPGAGSTGGWFPGQGGSNGPGAGSTGDWFPGQGGGGSNIPGFNFPGSRPFCSIPGIKCATPQAQVIDDNIIGIKKDDSRVISGTP